MLLDLAIIIITITAVFRGREIGFVRQLCSTIGFFGGLFIGALLEPHTVRLAHSATSRSLVTIITTLGCALILLSLGEYLGMLLKHRVLLKSINSLDNILGAGLSVISLLLSIWLTAAIINALPIPSVQTAVRSSRIIAALDKGLPSAPTVIGDLGRLIDPNGFPQVFIGNEPSPNSNVTLPNLGVLQAAVNKDRASVVKLEGQGCGGIVEGSGFVAGNGIIVTNAHVVAGISHPYIEGDTVTETATPIWFDPNLDLAVLRVGTNPGPVLPIASNQQPNGTPGAVLGYPGGGPFSAGAAAILDEFTATGRNIYGSGNTNRNIYEIRADVIPGNSGGPLVEENGDVMGIVFAESTTYNHVGYALTTAQVVHELHEAEAQNHPVSTGDCAE